MTTRGQLLATLFVLFALFIGTGFVFVQQARAAGAESDRPALTASAGFELGRSRWRGHYNLYVRLPKGFAEPDTVRESFARHLQRRFGDVQVRSGLTAARQPHLGTIVVTVEDHALHEFVGDHVCGVDVLDYLAVKLRFDGHPEASRWDGEYLLNSDVMVLDRRQPKSASQARVTQIDALVADMLTGMVAEW